MLRCAFLLRGLVLQLGMAGVFPGLRSVSFNIPDNILMIVVIPVFFILHPVVMVVVIRMRLVDHDFITAVKVIIVIPGRQHRYPNPAHAIPINVFVINNAVININIREVIILNVVLAQGTPGLLCVDVYIDTHLGIHLRGKQQGCHESPYNH